MKMKKKKKKKQKSNPKYVALLAMNVGSRWTDFYVVLFEMRISSEYHLRIFTFCSHIF